MKLNIGNNKTLNPSIIEYKVTSLEKYSQYRITLL